MTFLSLYGLGLDWAMKHNKDNRYTKQYKALQGRWDTHEIRVFNGTIIKVEDIKLQDRVWEVKKSNHDMSTWLYYV